MTIDGVYFGEETADNILEAVDIVQRAGDTVVEYEDQTLSPNQFWYTKLTADLAAPADADNPTTATANVWEAKDDDTLVDTEEEINITNRFVGYSASSGDLVAVILEEGEYVPQTPGGGTRKLVMLCSALAGRAATGQNGGVLGTIGSAVGAVLGPHPSVENRIVQTGESIVIHNVWDIAFSAGQVVAVENGLLGFSWTPYGADCGTVDSSDSFWNEYTGSLGCE